MFIPIRFNTHMYVDSIMGHRTITVSDEAYLALAKLKKERESFTEVILRLSHQTEKGTLLEYIRTLKPNEELAQSIEKAIEDRGKILLKPA